MLGFAQYHSGLERVFLVTLHSIILTLISLSRFYCGLWNNIRGNSVWHFHLGLWRDREDYLFRVVLCLECGVREFSFNLYNAWPSTNLSWLWLLPHSNEWVWRNSPILNQKKRGNRNVWKARLDLNESTHWVGSSCLFDVLDWAHRLIFQSLCPGKRYLLQGSICKHV